MCLHCDKQIFNSITNNKPEGQEVLLTYDKNVKF